MVSNLKIATAEVLIFTVFAFFLPPAIAKDASLVILQALIQFDGVLIGFAGLIATVFATRPQLGGSRPPELIVFFSIWIAVFFIISVFGCVYDIAQLSERVSLTRTEILLPLFFVVMGVLRLFLAFSGIYPPTKTMLKS